MAKDKHEMHCLHTHKQCAQAGFTVKQARRPELRRHTRNQLWLFTIQSECRWCLFCTTARHEARLASWDVTTQTPRCGLFAHGSECTNNAFDPLNNTAYYCSNGICVASINTGSKVDSLECPLSAHDVLALLGECFQRAVWKIYIISPCYYFIKWSICYIPQPQVINIHIWEHHNRTPLLGNIIDPAFASRSFSRFFVVSCSQLMPHRLHYSGCASACACNSSWHLMNSEWQKCRTIGLDIIAGGQKGFSIYMQGVKRCRSDIEMRYCSSRVDEVFNIFWMSAL